MRSLAFALLNDDNGISFEAWQILMEFLIKEGGNADIISAIRIQDNRVFLPENF